MPQRFALVLFVMAGLWMAPAGSAEAPGRCDDPPAEVIGSASAQWFAREALNYRCAHQRLEDQLNNPAYALKGADVSVRSYPPGVTALVDEPSYRSVTPARMVPGAWAADPFRYAPDWQAAGRGSVVRVRFRSSYANTLMEGDLFVPPVPPPTGGFPGVIFTTGGSHAYRHLYSWVGEGLAEHGYVVLLYDVPGQGGSESFGTGPMGLPYPGPVCNPGPAPSPCTYIFESAVKDSLDYFLSENNPLAGSIDGAKIGLMGHSIGAAYATNIGEADPRVKAIVNLDSTGYLAPNERYKAHAPMLLISSDYPGQGVPEPYRSPPNPWSHQYGYRHLSCQATPPNPPSSQVCAANEPAIDSMAVGLRGSTHYEWAYLPYGGPPRSASRYGERVSFHYTLAWFDAYLKADPSGFTRLTARDFDGSSDSSSIGAGMFDPVAGNVPYKITGKPVGNHLSFYFRSGYWLKGGTLKCEDMRLDRKVEGSDIAACDR